MKIAIAVAVGVLAFAASQGFGQVTSSSGSISQKGQLSLTANFTAPAFSVPVITRAPYSADQVSEQTQTLNDGRHSILQLAGLDTPDVAKVWKMSRISDYCVWLASLMTSTTCSSSPALTPL